MTTARKSIVAELYDLLTTAASEEIADRIHREYKDLSLEDRLESLRARGVTPEIIDLAFRVGPRGIAHDFLLAAGSGEKVAFAGSDSPITKFGERIWIDGQPWQLYLDRETKIFSLELQAGMQANSVWLNGASYELSAANSESTLFEVKGLDYGESLAILDAHDCTEKSGKFAR
jgi:hypothetical protein